MAKRRKKKVTSRGLREWRKRQGRGAIMKPSTFRSIERNAAARGATDPQAVAGAAYWRTAREKYRGSRRRKRRGRRSTRG